MKRSAGTPLRSASAIASPAASSIDARSMFTASFVTDASFGLSPSACVSRPNARKSGSHRAMASPSPAASTTSSPRAAASGRPNTGAATKKQTPLGCARARRSASAGLVVLIATCTAPSRSDPIAAPSPSSTAHATASSSASIETIASAPFAASLGDSATLAPRLPSDSSLLGVRFHAVTSCFASTSRVAIAAPICPAPRNPTFIAASIIATRACTRRARCSPDPRAVGGARRCSCTRSTV